ncbi:MAG: ABC transporter substrate-binding protein [Betaproteobacteria bacterium]|nr:ABC transporter substrate-binding protein [Betaproteobacteria bacterium]MBU6511319.1 ABC transporter substrate-binding protein [Betaproteobacteria bacterium]MDE1954490.1 ABC transporter substrate-binding protein [Betaproteobacteria bacterium]MDE2151261.1 ABC transporter substrate-binding protein [Betaproteobacteria bacterium]MDE2479359.1 ABC transporter substrate-binding protein [Betaproteobacteria bacterium]
MSERQAARRADGAEAGGGRREFLGAAGAAAAVLALPQAARAAGNDAVRVGFVSPLTGPLAGFGQTDPFIIDLVRKRTGGKLKSGSSTLALEILPRDTQSDPSRASQLAKELINEHHVDLMLATSTPEVVNPVADACEAAGVPCLSTVDPWESWYFGRGAKPGQPSPFHWTYHFSFGVAQFAAMYLSIWDLMRTNKVVGALYPNDADGNALREHLVPALEKAGYKVVDPGAYQDGTTNFSAQIQKFKAAGVQILTGAPLPNDFAVFLRQAAQQGLARQLRIVTPAKVGLFPADVQALGRLGLGIATGAYWSPAFPYVSPVAGVGGQQLVDAYQKASGKQWTQQLGASLSLFDAGLGALARSGAPKDRNAVIQAIRELDVVTTVGRVNFRDGPVPNVATTPLVGAQWLAAPSGSRFPLEYLTVEHADDPKVRIETKLHRYHI